MNRQTLYSLSVLAMAFCVTAFVLTASPSPTQAHCQIPCGIYDDGARITHIREDSTTIAKAIKNINELAGKHDGNSFNQLARWVDAKEHHASDIITTVAEYFLTQKVKPVSKGAEGYDAYLAKLADHHAVMSAAMKTKQSADPSTVANLNKAIDALATHYK